MRPNPLEDALSFLTKLAWYTPVFWLLLLGSIMVAVAVWRLEPAQRTAHAAGLWALRVLVGCMWWEQTLWKIPPNFDLLRHFPQLSSVGILTAISQAISEV